MDPHRRVRVWKLILPLVFFAIAAAAGVYGLKMQEPLLGVSAAAVCIAGCYGVIRYYRRVLMPIRRYWNASGLNAKARTIAVYRKARTHTGIALTLMVVLLAGTVVFSLSAGVAAVRSGANATEPGRAFQLYNEIAAPHLAELIELYIVRELPVDQLNDKDLRVLRNLYFAVEGYSFQSADLQEIFEPLVWYQPYESFPNDANALPNAYRRKALSILAIERRRAGRNIQLSDDVAQ